ncbi:MAG: hypothetical protein K8R53_00880 [Bacteroidales bacterium]|nr:hypothetical protein [Bacteroidales bacterium]
MKNTKKSMLIGVLAAGAIFGTTNLNASPASLFSYDDLGSGSEIRSTLLEEYTAKHSSMLLELKCGEDKSKESKCGEGKCGEDKTKMKKEGEKNSGDKKVEAQKDTINSKATKEVSTEKKTAKESKSKEAKCGEGKCGTE